MIKDSPMQDQPDVQVLRHSAAHLLAQAIKELYPDTQLTIGPATETGFFYDILPTTNFKEEVLEKIEARMREISDRNLVIGHEEVSKDKARELYQGNPFKLEMIDKLDGQTVGLSSQGDFYDLCRGGHVATTGDIKHFKLTNISGSYWRADRDGQALQRISGIAFNTQKELETYERKREEALLYDHRRIGKQLDLFSFHNEGVGFPFFHPKGKTVVNILVDFMRKLQLERNYSEVSTPIILNDELWKRSGHYAHYKENMYFCEIDEKQHAVKPMNCPGAFIIYNNRPRSYRELPLRLSEFGICHRHELSGVLHGLFRARSFLMDDAHIVCTAEQLRSEILGAIRLVELVLKTFGFKNLHIGVSTRPESSMGSDQIWQTATDSLTEALTEAGLDYVIQEGEGAFYGPKIEFVIKDSMDREWQCGTVQVDFFQPENFDLTYVAASGKEERPVIIHRAIYGSLERFFAILLEHYKGHLPYWLAPVQARILTITDDQQEYAQTLLKELKAAGCRVELEESSDPLSGKIKSAQIEKIPWMLIIGKKEQANGTVTLRHNNGKQEFGLSVAALLEKAKDATPEILR